MRQLQFASVWVSMTVLSGLAAAQRGMVDQYSPEGTVFFNEDSSLLTWQQQVRVGVGGQLEGVAISLYGPVGAQMFLRIRPGNAPSVNAAIFSTIVTKATAIHEYVFVSTTAAGLMFATGQTFVLETSGNGTQATLVGNYRDPAFGPPLYAEPLFLNGAPDSPGYRHAFTTYVLTSPALCYANCDGSATTPILNVLDLSCFLNRYAAGDSYANCDGSTLVPVLNVLDFACFMDRFAAGCS